MDVIVNIIALIVSIVITLASVALNVVQKIKNGKKVDLLNVLDSIVKPMVFLEDKNIDGDFKKQLCIPRIKESFKELGIKVTDDVIDTYIEKMIDFSKKVNAKEIKKDGEKKCELVDIKY